MTYEQAFMTYYDGFSDWLYNNYMIGNGTMLVNLLERPEIFENFMQDHHPEVEYD